METSSIIILSLIGVAALVICFRNVRYNRERDHAYQAYRKAVEALRTEFSDNLDLISRMRNEIASGKKVLEEHFKTEVWLSFKETSLTQMDDNDANELRQIYNLIEQTETDIARLIGTSNQQLSVSPQIRKECRTSFLRALDELATTLRKTLARVP